MTYDMTNFPIDQYTLELGLIGDYDIVSDSDLMGAAESAYMEQDQSLYTPTWDKYMKQKNGHKAICFLVILMLQQ